MNKWNLLLSKAELDGKAKALRRKCRGHFFSNYVWFSDAIKKEFLYSKMWLCEDGDNILLLQQYDTFYKLFYFVGDVEKLIVTLPDETQSKHVLCEFFEEEGKEKQTEVLKELLSSGFKCYRKFYMFESSENSHLEQTPEDITFDNCFTESQLRELFSYFDPYVDLIPLQELFDEYYNKKSFFVCYVNYEYAGVIVYTIKDAQINEDFVFVKPKFRGIGKYLYAAFLKHAFIELGCKKVVPWVHTDNLKSMSFHKAAGAVQTPYYKMSLLTNIK